MKSCSAAAVRSSAATQVVMGLMQNGNPEKASVARSVEMRTLNPVEHSGSIQHIRWMMPSNHRTLNTSPSTNQFHSDLDNVHSIFAS